MANIEQKTMAKTEHLNTAKFYTYDGKFIDSYDFDNDVTDSNTICDIIKYAYAKNADMFIAHKIYFQGEDIEPISKIIINGSLEIRIYY